MEDNSPDGTLQVAQKISKLYGEDKILILSRPGKLGLGSAYKDGLHKCSGEFVFLMDADMSHHPKHIPQFIRWIDNFIVIYQFYKIVWICSIIVCINDKFIFFKQAKGKGLRYCHGDALCAWWRGNESSTT